MTKYVCSHHIVFVLWIIFNVGMVFPIVFTSINLTEPHSMPSLDLPINQFVPLDDAYEKYVWSLPYLCLEIVACGAINGLFLFFANERYHWLGLKSCETKSEAGSS